MQNKEQFEVLEKIFSNVNSWLNFAEAKHGANIAFVIAYLAVIISTDVMNILTCSICILLICSGGCSVLSFYPKTSEGANLLFFERIKIYSGQDYMNQIKQNYFPNNIALNDRYLSDLADEIVINSKIASRKYQYFKVAIKFNLLSLALFAIYVIMA